MATTSPPLEFASQTIIITGAGSGIGRATALKLASLGATLALTDLNPSTLDETKSLCTDITTNLSFPSSSSPPSHLTSAFDIGNSESCNAFIELVLKTYTKINHVFNCAGVNPTSYPTATIPDSYYDKLFNTNIHGVFALSRAAIPHLQSGSSFVNVSSISGLRPTAGHALYCATKYAVIGFSKCLALELGPKGIRVNIVAPGFIDTPTNASVVEGPEAVERQRKGVALGRIGRPEEIADVVAFLMGEGARYMSGSVVEVGGGLVY